MRKKNDHIDIYTQPLIPTFTKETISIEQKKKSKERKAGYFVDKRNLYPIFIKDADNFYFCDYINPSIKKKCNVFFTTEKSINAHYSRVHNKDQNPNRLRRLEKEGRKIIENMVEHQTQKTCSVIPETKQSTLF